MNVIIVSASMNTMYSAIIIPRLYVLREKMPVRKGNIVEFKLNAFRYSC
jgi:hypothetical protein